MVEYSECWRYSGSPVAMGDLPRVAYLDLPDMGGLQSQDVDAFEQRVRQMISEYTRVELYAKDAEGRLLGSIIAGVNDDIHYGTCFAALIQYVHPDARKLGVYRKLYRMFIKCGHELGLSLYHTTHWRKPGEYIHKYRRIENG